MSPSVLTFTKQIFSPYKVMNLMYFIILRHKYNHIKDNSSYKMQKVYENGKHVVMVFVNLTKTESSEKGIVMKDCLY